MADQQAAQLSERIDAARGSTGFDQAVPDVIIIAKEDRLAQAFGEHRDKWQFQQRQERTLMRNAITG